MGFAAGFAEKLFAIEIVFDGDLREEQAAAVTRNDDQAVAADFDGVDVDRLGLRQQRDFDLKVTQVGDAHWSEARILQRGAGSTSRDAVAERSFGFDDADAAAQVAVVAQRDEYTAPLAEDSIGGNVLRQTS